MSEAAKDSTEIRETGVFSLFSSVGFLFYSSCCFLITYFHMQTFTKESIVQIHISPYTVNISSSFLLMQSYASVSVSNAFPVPHPSTYGSYSSAS